MFRKVLIAVDGSAHSKRAVAYGAKIAAQNGAEVVLFHVMRHLGSDRVPPDLEELEHIEHVRLTEADMLRSVAEAVVNEANDLAGEQGATKVRTVIQDGDPATRILEYCKAHEVDNLYVVDTSCFCSIGAVNPSLTAMANALRVGDHILDRMR
jgi:nucleotide-binding universal stress UspA family protein